MFKNGQDLYNLYYVYDCGATLMIVNCLKVTNRVILFNYFKNIQKTIMCYHFFKHKASVKLAKQ